MIPFRTLFVRFSTGDDGSATIRKWSQFPFDGSQEYAATAAMAELNSTLEAQQKRIAELETDYLRRHNEATDRWLQIQQLESALKRIADATPRSTNSASANDAFAFCAAVAETALATLHPGVSP